MPAVMRPASRPRSAPPGGKGGQGGPQARGPAPGKGAPPSKAHFNTQPKPAKPPRAPRAKAGRPYAPAKLAGVRSAGLAPQAAVAAAALVLLAGGALALGTQHRAQAVAGAMSGGVDGVFARLGFKLARVDLQGASSFAQPYVMRAAGLETGRPILGLNLSELRERIEAVGYVKSARVQRLLPDTLAISVVERPRLAVWQHAGRLAVVDDRGQAIPEADAALFPDLPLVVGEGAAESAGAVLPLVQARPRLMRALEALVRVDARRWDLRLKDGGLIQLPAKDEDAALIQLDQLDQRSRLLELGFERIDLRDPEMVVVRPRAGTTIAGTAGADAAASVAGKTL